MWRSVIVLISLILFTGFSAIGQSVLFDTFYLKSGGQFEELQTEPMRFPVVKTGNKKVDSLINADIVLRFLDGEWKGEHPSQQLEEWAGEQIVYLDFDVTYNQWGVLSLNISAEGCGAYCSGWTKYFNYKIADGQRLEIGDVIDATGELLEVIRQDWSNQFLKYKEELREALNDPDGEVDEETYQFVLEEIEPCLQELRLDRFSIFPDRLLIIEHCSVPNSIKNLTPLIEISYPLKDISKYLKMQL